MGHVGRPRGQGGDHGDEVPRPRTDSTPVHAVTSITGHHHGHGHDGRSTVTPTSSPSHRTVAEIKAAIDRSALSDNGRKRARRPCSIASPRRRRQFTTCRWRRCICTRSARSTRSSTLSARCSRSSGLTPTASSSRRSTSAAGWSGRAHGLYPCPRRRRCGCWRSAGLWTRRQGRAAHADRCAAAERLRRRNTARCRRCGSNARVTAPAIATSRAHRTSPASGRRKRDRARLRAARRLVIECEIDDMNPQIFGVLMDRLYAGGALDVFYSPVQMKKNRPGTLVTIIAQPAEREALTDVMFRESTTIGVRYTEMERECLDREIVRAGDAAWHGSIQGRAARGTRLQRAAGIRRCRAAAAGARRPDQGSAGDRDSRRGWTRA